MGEQEGVEDVLSRGMKALMDALGLVDAIRFLQAVGMARGDYTAERHRWLDDATVDDTAAEARARCEARED